MYHHIFSKIVSLTDLRNENTRLSGAWKYIVDTAKMFFKYVEYSIKNERKIWSPMLLKNALAKNSDVDWATDQFRKKISKRIGFNSGCARHVNRVIHSISSSTTLEIQKSINPEEISRQLFWAFWA